MVRSTLDTNSPHINAAVHGDGLTSLQFRRTVGALTEEHPFYKHVYLRMMNSDGSQPRIVAYVYGGQGTINVPSWSPDSPNLAFVSNSKMEDTK